MREILLTDTVISVLMKNAALLREVPWLATYKARLPARSCCRRDARQAARGVFDAVKSAVASAAPPDLERIKAALRAGKLRVTILSGGKTTSVIV